MVETILAQNGLNTGCRRPNFVSAFNEYVLQTELPRGWKVPKYTKFAGHTDESTEEHIARYLAESGNLANNENLRMKYFPNLLTKNAFTWFTTVPPNSIHSWAQLERTFHEQFYMGKTKISLKELASVDADPLPNADATYVEVYDCNMVEVVDAAAPIEAVPEEEYEKRVHEVYPNVEEELVDFLNRCKLKNSEVMLCPRCSAVCDKEAIAGLQNVVPYAEN
ncbi:uncharacterized protein LOC123914884 [Trifolium pratense]|uniref:uncharacterized protein LOC123914884 n=1 Tax=Trifolium pratense TaxID=57577 RepID=UPI001E6909A5|nr:uncharacterized protein LOC123914884 [Trifolium pratense]